MAPLYKRYIPAKSSTERPETPVKPVLNGTPESATTIIENKRKRERSEEEILERKAKKLRKKGVDPETVSVEKIVEQNDIKSQDASLQGVQSEVVEQSQEQRLPMKKRHKLEKEARKARKAAEKDKEDGEGPVEALQDPVPTENEQPSDEAEVVANGAESAIEAGEELPFTNAAHHEDEETEGKAKRKKRRKEGGAAIVQEPQESTVASSADAEPLETTSIVEDAPEEAPSAKKRRHKLEHVLEGSPTEDAKAGDDEHLRKHSSVLGKFQKSASRAIRHQQDSFVKLAEHQVVQDLELPPPERTPTPEFETDDAALPPWLAKPTFVTGHSKATFRDLNIEATTADRLSKLGFAEALPVQQALVPLLLPPGMSGATYPPGTEDVLPDVAVSAPTGSGKTIAYLLPMIEALRHQRQHGKISALVVVPTRELVMQVAAVAESLVKGSSIKVGMATGTGRFKDEQEKITTRHAEYDPAGYQRLVDEAKSQIHPPDEDSDEFESFLDQSGQEDNKRQQWIQETVSGLVDHVPKYSSVVDILVATPGRLLEHIDNTLGFNLVHLQWLVLDEADKLLDHQNEGFLESLNVELSRPRNEEEQDARERYLRSQAMWEERKERRLRKVVLSATMTRDISKLTSLNLRRPKMIVVRGGDSNSDAQAEEGARGESSVKESADGFELPPTLIEYCVPVGDGSEKPLVVVELLRSKILGDSHSEEAKQDKPTEKDNGVDAGSDSDLDSDSDDTSSLSSDDSDSSSSASESEDSSDDDDDSCAQQQDSPVPARSPSSQPAKSVAKSSLAPTILIFTSSNESATRLTHLLQNLQPTWKPHLTSLLKTNTRPRIRSKPTEPAIVISTDRAARGLDAFSNRHITHVVQYDVPRTLTSYVHRVGRTARAGREGDAWTLYTHAEARWFVNKVTKAENVSRRTAVERVKVFMADEGMRERYQTVLAGMRDEVFGAAT